MHKPAFVFLVLLGLMVAHVGDAATIRSRVKSATQWDSPSKGLFAAWNSFKNSFKLPVVERWNLAEPEAPKELSAADLKTMLKWVEEEYKRAGADFCYMNREPKPMICADGLVQDGLVCYNGCKNNYRGVGPLCWEDCRSDYTDFGFTCTKKLNHGDCKVWQPWKCDTYGKGNYNRGPGAGRTLDSCYSHQSKEGALCYKKCPEGLEGCGAGGCASSPESCASAIIDMIVSPALMVANIATMGTAAAATVAARMAVKTSAAAARVAARASTASFKAARATTKSAASTISESHKILKAKKGAKFVKEATDKSTTTGQTAKKLVEAETTLIENAENDFAGISSDYIEDTFAQVYPKDTPVYKQVAKAWAMELVSIVNQDLDSEFAKTVVCAADITGILGTINAFVHDQCKNPVDVPRLTPSAAPGSWLQKKK